MTCGAGPSGLAVSIGNGGSTVSVTNDLLKVTALI